METIIHDFEKLPITIPKLKRNPRFIVEDDKYYEEIQHVYESNDNNIRCIDFRQWIEKPFPSWLIFDNHQ